MIQPGSAGFRKSPESRYAGYGTKILDRSDSGDADSAGLDVLPKPDQVLLLSSMYEAYDPDFLVENKVDIVISVGEVDEVFPPETLVERFMGEKSANASGSKAEFTKAIAFFHLPVRESPRTPLPFDKVFAILDECFNANINGDCETKNTPVGPAVENPLVQACRVGHNRCQKASVTTVLIHCREGRNRSASLLLGWLMHRSGCSLGTAFEFVKKRRSLVDPNIGYMKQLLDMERLSGSGGCDYQAAAGAFDDQDQKRAQQENAHLSEYYVPSLGFSKADLVDLLDLELIGADGKSLGLYANQDVTVVEYEGMQIQVERQMLKDVFKTAAATGTL